MKYYLGFTLVGTVLAVQVEVASRATERVQAILQQASRQSTRVGKAEVALDTVETLAAVAASADGPSTFTSTGEFTSVVESINTLLSEIVDDMVKAKKANQRQLNDHWWTILKTHDKFNTSLTSTSSTQRSTSSQNSWQTYINQCGVEMDTPNRTHGPWDKFWSAEEQVETDCVDTDFRNYVVNQAACTLPCVMPSGLKKLGELEKYLAETAWKPEDLLESTSSQTRSALNEFFLGQVKEFVDPAYNKAGICKTQTAALKTNLEGCKAAKLEANADRCAQDAAEVSHCRVYAQELADETLAYSNLVNYTIEISEERATEAMIVDKVKCILDALDAFVKDRAEDPSTASNTLQLAITVCRQRTIPKPVFGDVAKNWMEDGIMQNVTKLVIYERPGHEKCNCSYIPLCAAGDFDEDAEGCKENFESVTSPWQRTLLDIVQKAPFELVDIVEKTDDEIETFLQSLVD